MPELKKIVYRGGVVTFFIPASWKEEYVPEGGGTFYDDDPDSGTLRLNVLTLQSKHDLTENAARNALMLLKGERKISDLPDGNAIARHSLAGEEDGVKLKFRIWEIANPLPPRHIRMAVFNFCFPAWRESAIEIQKTIEMLDALILQAKYAQIIGS